MSAAQGRLLAILLESAASSLLSSLDPGNCRAPNGHRLERLRPHVYGLMMATEASSLGEAKLES
jgi:hypothetical protein